MGTISSQTWVQIFAAGVLPTAPTSPSSAGDGLSIPDNWRRSDLEAGSDGIKIRLTAVGGDVSLIGVKVWYFEGDFKVAATRRWYRLAEAGSSDVALSSAILPAAGDAVAFVVGAVGLADRILVTADSQVGAGTLQVSGKEMTRA